MSMICPTILEIEAFVRAVELESISASARRLNITVQAASRRVNVLEDKLGCALLERQPRRVRPTAAGAAFYVRALSVLSMVRGAMDAAEAAHRGAVWRPAAVAAAS